MTNVFEDYRWHSCAEPRRGISEKRIIRSLPVKASIMEKFRRVASDSSFLIHKSSRALWKFSEDGKTIEPVFQDDVLTEDKL